MGQEQSVPATALQSPPPRGTTTTQAKDKDNPNALKVPSAWKNDADFLLISPNSDLSNPSQFRGRLRHNQAAATVSAPLPPAPPATAAAVVSSVRRSRTSKVCPKQAPPTVAVSAAATASAVHRTHLPPPTRFYFATTPNRNDNASSTEEEEECHPNVAAIQPPPPPAVVYDDAAVPIRRSAAERFAPHHNHYPKRRSRSLVDTWRAKCAKAKQQLGECWYEKEHRHDDENEVPVPVEPRTVRHYSQRNHVGATTTTAQLAAGAAVTNVAAPYLQLEQFEPVWKEQLVEPKPMSGPSLHRERDQGPVITPNAAAQGATAGNSNTVPNPPATFDVTGNARSRLPSITYTTDTEASSASGLEGRALSLQSNNRRSLTSASSTNESSANNSSVITSTVLQEKGRDKVNRRSSLESHKRSSNHTTNNRRDSVASTVLKEQSDNQSARVKVASTVPATTTTTKQAELLSRNDAFRTSIEQQVQEQIDAQQQQQQTMSRVQRLRQQYQEEIERFKVVQPPQPPPENIPAMETKRSTKSDRFSIPTTVEAATVAADNEPKPLSVAEKRRVFENRAASVPSRRSSEETYDKVNVRKQSLATAATGRASRASIGATTTTSRRRSVSAPRVRPSIEGSALLHMSGRWNSNVAPPAITHHQPQQQLPVLLKMAGWEKENLVVVANKPVRSKVASFPEKALVSKRVQRPIAATTKEHRLSTQSEPLPPPAMPVVVATRRKVPSLDVVPRRVPPPIRKGRTMALMLQQAYFHDDSEDEHVDNSNDDDDSPVLQRPNYLALAYKSPTARPLALVESSPALSVESTNTKVSGPLVSDEALFNAEFLFEADANLTSIPTISNTSSSQSITTWNSHLRALQSASGQPAEIPPNLSDQQSRSDSNAESGPSRRVRFSEEFSVSIDSIPKNQDDAERKASIPGIESKLSDLTDTTGMSGLLMNANARCRESAVSSHSSMSIPRIDSIPEEEYDDDNDPSPSQHFTRMANDEKVDIIFEDNEEDEATPQKAPIMRWSYRTEAGFMNGVTPNINGKGNASRVTSSPYIRFKAAKDKFASVQLSAAEPLPKKESPVKRVSPAKRANGSLVTARVAAMEGRRVRSEGGSTFKVVRAKKKRRATTGTDVLAPRKGTLASPMFKPYVPVAKPLAVQEEAMASISEDIGAGSAADDKTEMSLADNSLQSPTLVNGHLVRVQESKLQSFKDMNDSFIASVVSTDSEDAFGAILHPNAIDEDSDDGGNVKQQSEFNEELNVSAATNGSDSDDDDFNQLLNYEESEEETSNRQRATPPMPHSGSRMSVDGRSVVSMSSNDDTASVPSWLKGRPSVASQGDEYSVVSAVGRMKGVLPFREAAPVKPNEQQQRAPPGSQCLSQMQRTPMQARTWRVLAAAAQEKQSQRNPLGGGGRRSSLSERSLNTFGR